MTEFNAQQHEQFLRRYAEHEPALRAFVRSLVPTREDAREVMQEVAVVLWRKFGQRASMEDSGKLAGPWKQQAEPIFGTGGHAMLFTTVDGKSMMVLHSPNGPGAQPRVFEMEDT
jgi:hypothetical protein